MTTPPLDEAWAEYLAADPAHNRPSAYAGFAAGWLAALRWRRDQEPGGFTVSDDLNTRAEGRVDGDSLPVSALLGAGVVPSGARQTGRPGSYVYPFAAEFVRALNYGREPGGSRPDAE